MTNNDVNIRLFLHRLSAGFMDIAYIHGKVYAIDGYLLMRWVEYDHEEVPFFMDKYSIHGSATFMDTMQHLRQQHWLTTNRGTISPTGTTDVIAIAAIIPFCNV